MCNLCYAVAWEECVWKCEMINVGCRIDRIRTFCVIRGQHAFYKNREKRGTLSYKKRKNRGTRNADTPVRNASSEAESLSYKNCSNRGTGGWESLVYKSLSTTFEIGTVISYFGSIPPNGWPATLP